MAGLGVFNGLGGTGDQDAAPGLRSPLYYPEKKVVVGPGDGSQGTLRLVIRTGPSSGGIEAAPFPAPPSVILPEEEAFR